VAPFLVVSFLLFFKRIDKNNIQILREFFYEFENVKRVYVQWLELVTTKTRVTNRPYYYKILSRRISINS
jgi:hypothetical protein